MILYGYGLSSASYRVRIALGLKGVPATHMNKQLRLGEHRLPDFLELNPQGFVPALRLDDGEVLTQSIAIIEYLEETYPQPALLPAQPTARARVRALCQLIACDIHPLNNLRVLKYLQDPLGQSQAARDAWYAHWVQTGFEALERLLGAADGPFCGGAAPCMADVLLVPQVFNARRFKVHLDPYPRIVAIDAECRALPAFANAAPELHQS